jgi:hypothetical protein
MYICTLLYICTRTVVRQPTAAYRAQNHGSLAELICWLGFRVYWLGPIIQSHPHPIFIVPLSVIFLHIFLLFLLLQLLHPCSPSFLPLVFFLSFLLLHFPSLLPFPFLLSLSLRSLLFSFFPPYCHFLLCPVSPFSLSYFLFSFLKVLSFFAHYLPSLTLVSYFIFSLLIVLSFLTPFLPSLTLIFFFPSLWSFLSLLNFSLILLIFFSPPFLPTVLPNFLSFFFLLLIALFFPLSPQFLSLYIFPFSPSLTLFSFVASFFSFSCLPSPNLVF